MVYVEHMRTERRGAIIAFVLLLALSSLTPLGYASPPDPSWIRGIYDGADYDDVVDLVTSAVAASAPILLFEFRAISLIGFVPQGDQDPVPHVLLRALPPRAPPAS